MQDSKPLYEIRGQVVELTPFLKKNEASKYGEGTITIVPKGYNYEDRNECVKFSVKDELVMNEIEASVRIDDEVKLTFVLDGRNYEDRQTGKYKNMTGLSALTCDFISSGEAVRKKKELLSRASILTADELEALLSARAGVLTAVPKPAPVAKTAPQKPVEEPANNGGEEEDADLPF